MIIVCKHRKMPGRLYDEYINLTIGKKYISLTDFYDSGIMIQLVDDSGHMFWYLKENFIPVHIEREEKLKELGILD